MTAIDRPSGSPAVLDNPFPDWPLQPFSLSDNARVTSLESYGILDTPPEAAFDDITRMAMMICGTPVAVINLIGAERQWFKSEAGLSLGELPFLSSIFAHTTQGADVFVVPDLTGDERFADHPLVTHSPAMRFYAGAPLRTSEGHTLGTVAVLDCRARQLDEEQTEALRSLARQVMVLFELRRTARLADELLARSDQLNAALLRADASKNELLGMIAHELNSPLALILGTAISLRAEIIREPEDKADAYSQLITSTRRLSRVVSNMLALAPAAGGCSDLEMEPLLLKHSFDAAIAEHHHVYPGSEVQLSLDVDLPIACGDPVYFDQIITNLLSNAAKYGAVGEPIVIVADTWGPDVRVSVSNAGPVLNPENIERLFAPFYRELGPGAPMVPGVGLGLAVCRRLAEAQGGRILAVARPFGGLEVSFTLPALQPETER